MVSTASPPTRRRNRSDFEFKRVLGEGSFSTVHLGIEKESSREFAVKVLDKAHIVKESKEKYVTIEKQVFTLINPHPLFTVLYFTFQDSTKLYFVLELAPNGELLDYIKRLGSFDVVCTRFYAAEILLALEFLHEQNILHRDVKPENILIGADMHIKVTDFGTAKILKKTDEKQVAIASSFVGTAEYVSPELLNEKVASSASDIWALGCIIYQLLSGRMPFHSFNEYQTFQQVLNVDYSFPIGFDTTAKDLVTMILVLNPDERLTCPQIKGHDFFKEIKWDVLIEEPPPKLRPYLPKRSESENELYSSIETGVQEELERLDIIPEVATKERGSHDRPTDRQALLKKQSDESPWSEFVGPDDLIVRAGLVEKRAGLLSKRRQLVLTDKPSLVYIDPDKFILKGEIPWSSQLVAEFKTATVFFVHTPSRTYYLQDASGDKDAKGWCKYIAAEQKRAQESATRSTAS